MRRIIGRQNRFGRRRGKSWLETAIWIAFGFGIVLGAFMLLASAAANEASQNASSVSANGEAPAEGLRQVPSSSLNEPKTTVPKEEQEQINVIVYLTKEQRTERVPLETYVRGVVAAEMPAAFKLEALKAQAIAARTYIVRRMELKDRSGMPEAAAAAKAVVTDTVQHQVYVPLDKLESYWPDNEQQANLKKLNQAVEGTKGRIITYDGEPIQAVFFSTSNGYTENAEDYWQLGAPYLRSVASPWDEAISPRYKETLKFSLSEFYAKLGVDRIGKPDILILKKTAGNRIAELSIDGNLFTGREVREKLALASSQFTWSIKGKTISITTYGYGHGVGMSQWGANGMAEAGKNAEEIVTYYYSGTKVERVSKLVSS
ncbi:stage II sporulation protein D [Paenibacillus sp. NEAU-GSW1]|uniref:stage II sporulation protein D n=1 Tax=Paenibacillus sp. NEAU-GSW1 TaxID=2682486 RepID=UPI0012E1254C|nr:stage II sporulation protein D [Paenibacillus sp. NEAU-GSW1]MUT65053.1 stage II sporulation protein D [Paenibacillus sp. NEAU-GSW1]